jgi:hypothetical protein
MHHMQLEVVKLSDAKQGCVLLLKRWVIEWSVDWAGWFCRLAQDYVQRHWETCILWCLLS